MEGRDYYIKIDNMENNTGIHEELSPLPHRERQGESLLIIGAGPGGYRAAELAAKQGLKVVIFEQGEVGGTCLNVGCIPTKCYVHSATFEEARERMTQVVSQLRQGVEGILSHPNITLIREKAAFVDSNTVKASPSGEVWRGVPIIIATGSETKWLPIEGVRTNPRVVDSTGLLQLETLPKRLCIIGAGVIGMEFASVFHRFGSEVTVIEFLKECLPALDGDIAKRLRKQMEKEGITFHMQCAVKQIADGEVFFETKKGKMESVEADVILMATGRKPRTEGLNLEAAGITLAPNGSIPVDDNFLTFSNSPCLEKGPGSPPKQGESERVYAIGDVNGKQMLAHAAEHQALLVVEQILQPPLHSERAGGETPMPAAIFTEPEAACVGPTEDQLKEQGIEYVCKKSFWRANGKALAMGETEGMLKLFVTPPSEGQGGGSILGCHAYGAHAADIVQEVSVLMCRNTTVEQLRQMVHIHPTLSEILLDAVN